MSSENSAILIVDDDPVYRSLLKKRLNNADYITAEADTGEQALDILRVETYDLILLDLNMPGIDGFAVLETVKNNSHTEDIDVIVLTADSHRDNVVSSLTLGAKDFISKSASRTELINRVRHICDARTLEKTTNTTVKDTDITQCPILIIDDEKLSLELTRQRLQRMGFTVFCLSDTDNVLEYIQKHKIRLVLLDIDMPGMNGHTLLQNLRKTFTQEDLSVVMVTAIDDPDMVIDCINDKADDYIMKPYHPTVMQARICSVLKYSLLQNRRRMLSDEHSKLNINKLDI